MDLLEVKNLKVIFPTMRGVVQAVNGVDFHQKYGENVGLVGESGAGKTMMGRAFMGLLPYPGQVVEGDIFWNGESLLKKKDKDFRRLLSKEISMVFQDPISALNPLKKIGDQIIEAILLHQDYTLTIRKQLSQNFADVLPSEECHLIQKLSHIPE